MKILIIGSAGFIGLHLIKKLVKTGHQVVAFDVNPHPPDYEKVCKCYSGDLLSREDLMNAVKDVDLIISLAAKHHDFGVSREEFFRVNEGGTQLLLDVAKGKGITKFIFYSSVAVYGTRKEPSTEVMIPQPDSNYGESKLASEQCVYRWSAQDKKRSAIIIRPTVIYGPNNFGNVYNLLDKIYRKKFIFVGKGVNIKSVAYVENLVDATIFLIDKLQPGVQIFNYSDEPQLTISEIVALISKNMPRDIPKIRLPLWFALSLGSVFDFLAKISGYNFPITAARMKKFATTTHHNAKKIREHGFTQRIGPDEGFKKMVMWYLNTQITR